VDNIKTAAGQRVVVRQVTYSDHELALAYNAAEALILPSLYEGFDMPAADAMACGCPVITTHCGSLKEVAGDAPLVVPGASVPEMVAAMREVRNPSVRARHRAAGLLQAQRFSWDEMAEKVLVQLRELHAESTRGVHDAFFRRWSELRRLQADVDF